MHHLQHLLHHLRMRPKQFAEAIGLLRSDRVYHVLNGRNKISPNLAKLILSVYPTVSYQWLLNGDGAMHTLPPMPNAIPIASPNVMMVPLVGQYAYAGFQQGFADAEYLESLPMLPFLCEHYGHGNYMAFEVKGDSMDSGTRDGFEEGDILLCREVAQHLWIDSKLHINQWNFVLLTVEGLLVKRIIQHDVENRRITLHSLNSFYPDREIDLREVQMIFNVVMSQRKERL